MSQNCRLECPDCGRVRYVTYEAIRRIEKGIRRNLCRGCATSRYLDANERSTKKKPYPPIPVWHYHRSFEPIKRYGETWAWMETDCIVTICAGGFLKE